jgi:hypothetical protein
MPAFQLDPDHIHDLLSYLKSIDSAASSARQTHH